MIFFLFFGISQQLHALTLWLRGSVCPEQWHWVTDSEAATCLGVKTEAGSQILKAPFE